MGGWIGARMRQALGWDDLVRELEATLQWGRRRTPERPRMRLAEVAQQLEATKLRVKLLEQDSRDLWDALEQRTLVMPPEDKVDA